MLCLNVLLKQEAEKFLQSILGFFIPFLKYLPFFKGVKNIDVLIFERLSNLAVMYAQHSGSKIFYILYSSEIFFWNFFLDFFPLRNSKKLLSCHNLIEKIQFSKKNKLFLHFSTLLQLLKNLIHTNHQNHPMFLISIMRKNRK